MTDSQPARRAILAEIRRHLGAAPVAGARPQSAFSPTPRRVRYADRDARTAAFVAALERVGGQSLRAADATAAAPLVAAWITARNPARVARSAHPRLAPLARALGEAGVDCPTARRDWRASTSCDVGITSAAAGIATTGSIVLLEDGSDPGARALSLLPTAHVAVLPTAQILDDLGDALDRIDPHQADAITFVTGPSRTADIEMRLVIGVHGPKELLVVLLDDAKDVDAADSG